MLWCVSISTPRSPERHYRAGAGTGRSGFVLVLILSQPAAFCIIHAAGTHMTQRLVLAAVAAQPLLSEGLIKRFGRQRPVAPSPRRPPSHYTPVSDWVAAESHS